MDRSVVRSFLAGIVTSHFFIGLLATIAVFCLIKAFPDLKIYRFTIGEASLVVLSVLWVLIIVHGQRRLNPDGDG